MRPTDCDDLYRDGRHYDRQHEGFVEDIPFYIEMARKYGGPVLELACGTGRITLPIAGEGITVTGVDVSEGMLAEARRKADESGVKVKFLRADCRNFALDTRFGLILLPFNSIAHLHNLSSIEGCLGCVRDHLKAGGRFILDMFNPRLEILLRDPAERYPVSEYADPDGRGKVVITENNVYDRASQVNRIKWYYRIGDGHEETTNELNMRVFFPQELDAMLHYNGFEIETKYGDFDKTPFTSDSIKQIPVCHIP
jgi:SAM-dependent methyltransferase